MTSFSVFGLGKLGASMAAAIAGRGFDVIGVDVNHAAVDLVNAGEAPAQEMGLAKAIANAGSRLRATTSHREAVLESDITFVVVPTPSDERGAFSLQYAAWAFREIGAALRDKSVYHDVVLSSTVLPGSTRFGLLPVLEQASGKTCGPDFGLCYSPEFIALGSVIHDFLNPDFTLVGEFDARSGETLERAYAAILENGAPCKRMSIENAELTKISINSFVTMKVTFANMLADLCEGIPGGEVDVVTDAVGSDSRIGRKYLTGALGYGGPCFPRDNLAMAFLARTLRSRADLIESTDRLNRLRAEAAVDEVRPLIGKGTTVAVLGLAFKPGSHVVEESQGVRLAKGLSAAGARVVAYDPLANAAARGELGDHAVLVDSLHDCLSQADVVVVTNPDPEFRSITADHLPAREVPVVVVDYWRILRASLEKDPRVTYIAPGTGPTDFGESALRALWDGTASGIDGR